MATTTVSQTERIRGTKIRCYCCDRSLSDFESTLKSASSGTYLDTCLKCQDGLGIETIGREDLSAFEEPEDYAGEVDDEAV